MLIDHQTVHYLDLVCCCCGKRAEQWHVIAKYFRTLLSGWSELIQVAHHPRNLLVSVYVLHLFIYIFLPKKRWLMKYISHLFISYATYSIFDIMWPTVTSFHCRIQRQKIVRSLQDSGAESWTRRVGEIERQGAAFQTASRVTQKAASCRLLVGFSIWFLFW